MAIRRLELATVPCFALLLFSGVTSAGVSYGDPDGGWTYIYHGDQDSPELTASLDGGWAHDSNDRWDGSAPGEEGTAPGGVKSFTEGDVTYLRIQDAGDPRGIGFERPSNRKIALNRDMFELVDKHYDQIKRAKPKVTKNSTGYNLWNVWDRETGIFDLTQVIIGGQGTLGLTTEATFRVVPRRKHTGLLVMFMRDVDELGELIPRVLQHKPATFEGFDDQTLWLSIRFMPSFLKLLGPVRFLRLVIGLIPDGLQLLRGFPKLVMMAEFDGDSEQEVRTKIHAVHNELRHIKARYEINGFEETPTEGASEKFWIMRRYSFQLLRSKVHDKHTAPFIDDFVVNPEHLPEFFPKMRKIIKKK